MVEGFYLLFVNTYYCHSVNSAEWMLCLDCVRSQWRCVYIHKDRQTRSCVASLSAWQITPPTPKCTCTAFDSCVVLYLQARARTPPLKRKFKGVVIRHVPLEAQSENSPGDANKSLSCFSMQVKGIRHSKCALMYPEEKLGNSLFKLLIIKKKTPTLERKWGHATNSKQCRAT